MPAKSKVQQRLIFSKRSQYKTKKDTPEKWKWIWDKGWEKVSNDVPNKVKNEIKEMIKKVINEIRIGSIEHNYVDLIKIFILRFSRYNEKQIREKLEELVFNDELDSNQLLQIKEAYKTIYELLIRKI